MASAHGRRWHDLAGCVDGVRTAFEIAAALPNHAPAVVFDGLNQLAALGLVTDGDGKVQWTVPEAARLVPLFDAIVRAVVPRIPATCPVALATAVPWPGRGWRGAAGSAGSPTEAVTAALGEAAERDALVWRRDRPVTRRTGPDGTMLDWVPARSLRTGREILQPARSCWRDHPDGPGANSNGCASGPTMAAAVERAFLELVERDAIGFWWRLQTRRPGIALGSIGDRLVAAAAEWLGSCGRALHLLDLTTDLGVPVVAALSWDGDGRGVGMGFAARWSVRAAARRAVCELVSAWTAMAAITDKQDPRDREAAHWLATASVDAGCHLVPAGTRRAEPAGDAGRWEAIADRHGLDVLAVDMRQETAGIPVVRVIVPGLITPWQTEATARLREVPGRMGWTVASTPNPVQFFF